MKLNVPIEVDVNLTPYEIICYLKQWIYPILKEHKKKNSDWCNSRAIVKDGNIPFSLYKFKAYGHISFIKSRKLNEIKAKSVTLMYQFQTILTKCYAIFLYL